MKLSLSPHEIDVEVKSMWGRMIIRPHKVSVLFNEPKLLKCSRARAPATESASFSALQRAEIAEIRSRSEDGAAVGGRFQCSSTSRNC